MLDVALEFNILPPQRWRSLGIVNGAFQRVITSAQPSMSVQFCDREFVESVSASTIPRLLDRRSISHPVRGPLDYYVGGKERPVLVLLNAYGQSLSFWDSLVRSLVEGFRVLIWQPRGTSLTGNVHGVQAVGDHVDDIHAILEAEKVTNCGLVAWCTGPKSAIEYSSRYPGRVSSMVLLAGGYKNWPELRGFYSTCERQLDALCHMVHHSPDSAGQIMETLKAGWSSEKAASDELAHTSRDEVSLITSRTIKRLVAEPYLTPTSIVNYARQLLCFWSHDIRPLIAKIDIPVLFVSGEMDNVTSPHMSREMFHLVPQSVYANISQGSHYLQYDNHELLCAIINAFQKLRLNFELQHPLVTVEKHQSTGNDDRAHDGQSCPSPADADVVGIEAHHPSPHTSDDGQRVH